MLRLIVVSLLLLCVGTVSGKKVLSSAYASFDESTQTLTFYFGQARSALTTYTLNNGTEYPGWCGQKIKKVVFEPSFASARPKSTYRWFSTKTFSGIEEIEGLEFLNTQDVEKMGYTFCDCRALTSLDVSHFDTSKVTDMSGMFYECTGLTSLDISHFNTSNVTNMSGMFDRCSGLTSLDVSHFDTSNVTDIYSMFSGCSGLTSLDVSHFDTSNVTDMRGMFKGCSGLTSLDVSHFDTSNVTNMNGMFNGCSGLTSLDLSNFDTKNIKKWWHMEGMFQNCSSLSTIYCGDQWDTDKESLSPVAYDGRMFLNCTSLIGGAGTVYDEDYAYYDYAHEDGGPSNPGYLTHIRDKAKSVANSDDLQDFIDGLLNSGEKGTAESPKEIPVAKDGLTIDNDVDIEDDLQLLIDGEKSESGNVNMSFTGGTIKLLGTGGCWGFVCVGFYGNTASQAKENGSGKDVATTGIINNGQIDLRNSTLNEGNYQICNQGRLMLDGATVVSGKNLIKSLQGGRIFFTSQPQHAVTIAIPTAADVEEGQPIVSGSDGYTLTEADAANITLTVPDGYECNYDAAQNALVVTSTNGITTFGTKAETVETYDLIGRKVERSKKGLSIQRMNNGIVKKIIIK